MFVGIFRQRRAKAYRQSDAGATTVVRSRLMFPIVVRELKAVYDLAVRQRIFPTELLVFIVFFNFLVCDFFVANFKNPIEAAGRNRDVLIVLLDHIDQLRAEQDQ